MGYNYRMEPEHGSLRTDILPGPQRRLWSELRATPPEFTLYGGTAIALQLGHRQSVDFDFFAFQDIDTHGLMHSVPYLANAGVLQAEPNTLTMLADRDGGVRVSFFGLPLLRRVMPPLKSGAAGVKIAHLLDLAGMKMAVIQHRAEPKDYLDIHAIWTLSGITPEQSLAAASVIYAGRFNPYDTLKALAYFGEDQLAGLPGELKTALAGAAKDFDFSAMRAHWHDYLAGPS